MQETFSDRYADFFKINSDNGCWEWIAGITPLGYGRASYHGKDTYAHRISWIMAYGEIPKGLCVCHKCDNPSCANPDHLFLGTQKENMHDRDTKGRNRFGNNATGKFCSNNIQRRSVGSSIDPSIREANRSKHLRSREIPGNTKITQSLADEIKSAYKKRINTIAMLSRKYGISKTQVFRIVSGEAWNSKQTERILQV